MKFKRVFIALLCLVFIGCSTEGPSNGDEGNGNGTEVCKDANGHVVKCTSTVDVALITIKAQNPDDSTGTFYVENGECSQSPEDAKWSFADKKSFEHKIKDVKTGDKFCVHLECTNRLFVPQTFEIKDGDNGAVHNFDWSTPGSWGLAPNGDYVGDEGDEYEVKTFVKDGKVFISGTGFPTPVNKNKFAGNNGNSGEIEGTISDDLKTITYKRSKPGKVVEDTLTLKE